MRRREWEQNGRKWSRTTKEDNDMCACVLHPVSRIYFSTSISPIRYRSFANMVLYECVRLLYDILVSLSLSFTPSLTLLSPLTSSYTCMYTSFLSSLFIPSWTPFLLVHSSYLSLCILPSRSLCLSFDLTRPDRLVHVAAAITISSPGLFCHVVLTFARKWIDLLQNHVPHRP